jgi:hypothetical protein
MLALEFHPPDYWVGLRYKNLKAGFVNSETGFTGLVGIFDVNYNNTF